MKQVISVVAFILAVCANAQWTVVNLNPAGSSQSVAYGVSGGQQVGYAYGFRASLWSGTAESWVDLHPAVATESNARCVGDGQQVGYARVDDVRRASLWSGTAGSWVNLNPAGATYSEAHGVGGGQQVGRADVGSVGRASLWSGTAGSWVDLHPAGASQSTAYGVDGGKQVGWVILGGVQRASLWTGTAGSRVDLHPAGATYSEARGVHGGYQVGSTHEATFVTTRAALWSGTAGSWVDLHPAGATYSIAYGVDGGQQVGDAFVGSNFRASLWSGTAASWVNLDEFLSASFASSEARGVWHDGAFTYVVGTGFNVTTNRSEALMWVSRSIAPTSYSTVRGTAFSGNLASLLNSDNNRLVIRPGFVFSVGEPPVQVRLNATAPTASPNGFSFSVESSASFGNAQQKVWLWNYVIDDYELLDTRLATTTDDVVTVTVRSDPSRFIQPGTLAIRALVSFRAVGPAFAYPWSGRIDKVWWHFPG
ncbi:MAG: hypothetical protein M3R13_11095 [Armatimonadota bacterium]|nr:hypothetical protein [Armatimonadota bacterium]